MSRSRGNRAVGSLLQSGWCGLVSLVELSASPHCIHLRRWPDPCRAGPWPGLGRTLAELVRTLAGLWPDPCRTWPDLCRTWPGLWLDSGRTLARPWSSAGWPDLARPGPDSGRILASGRTLAGLGQTLAGPGPNSGQTLPGPGQRSGPWPGP